MLSKEVTVYIYIYRRGNCRDSYKTIKNQFAWCLYYDRAIIIGENFVVTQLSGHFAPGIL